MDWAGSGPSRIPRCLWSGYVPTVPGWSFEKNSPSDTSILWSFADPMLSRPLPSAQWPPSFCHSHVVNPVLWSFSLSLRHPGSPSGCFSPPSSPSLPFLLHSSLIPFSFDLWFSLTVWLPSSPSPLLKLGFQSPFSMYFPLSPGSLCGEMAKGSFVILGSFWG